MWYNVESVTEVKINSQFDLVHKQSVTNSRKVIKLLTVDFDWMKQFREEFNFRFKRSEKSSHV
jgi:hypothetical protein